MQWQNGDGRSETDAPCSRRDIGKHQIRAGEHAKRAEMMLANPGGMETHLLSINRLVNDVGDEGVGGSDVVVVVVVAQGEIAEFHLRLLCHPICACGRR